MEDAADALLVILSAIDEEIPSADAIATAGVASLTFGSSVAEYIFCPQCRRRWSAARYMQLTQSVSVYPLLAMMDEEERGLRARASDLALESARDRARDAGEQAALPPGWQCHIDASSASRTIPLAATRRASAGTHRRAPSSRRRPIARARRRSIHGICRPRDRASRRCTARRAPSSGLATGGTRPAPTAKFNAQRARTNCCPCAARSSARAPARPRSRRARLPARGGDRAQTQRVGGGAAGRRAGGGAARVHARARVAATRPAREDARCPRCCRARA